MQYTEVTLANITTVLQSRKKRWPTKGRVL